MNRPSSRKLAPLVGLFIAAALFLIASAIYPGDYKWAEHSISSLFQPLTHTAVENTAKPIAVAAVFFFCLSMGFVFKTISQRGKSRFQKKTIEIAGIASMVYAFLVVTPMHDVLVAVALLFFLVAMGATLYLIYSEGRNAMLISGIVCLALPVFNAVMYYGNVLYGFMPIVQKVAILLWVGWLFVVYFSA